MEGRKRDKEKKRKEGIEKQRVPLQEKDRQREKEEERRPEISLPPWEEGDSERAELVS